MNAMKSSSADNTFDIVYAANVLHHLPDPPAGAARNAPRSQTWRRSLFLDPLRHNPLINYLPAHCAKEIRTKKRKYPWRLELRSLFTSLFPETVYNTFWLTTLWIFLRFY